MDFYTKLFRAIEEEFGKEILVRSYRGVTFTPAGEKVLAFCNKMTSELEQMKQQLEVAEDEICGTIHSKDLYFMPERGSEAPTSGKVYRDDYEKIGKM